MVCASVIVLPEPVTPSRVWYLSPRRNPAVSSVMALGWSPAGSNGATTSKWGLLMLGIYTAGISSGRGLRQSAQSQQSIPVWLGHRNNREARLSNQRQVTKGSLGLDGLEGNR